MQYLKRKKVFFHQKVLRISKKNTTFANYMSWFQSDIAASLFERFILVRGNGCRCLAQLQGNILSRRAIIQVGFDVDNAATQESITAMMQEIAQRARTYNCVYAEMRCMRDYSPYRNALEAMGWKYEPHYDVIIDTHAKIPLSKMRQIRSAERQGVHWRLAEKESDVSQWYQCLRHLYHTKVRRPLPNLSFFIRAWHIGLPLLVVENGEKHIVGGVLLVIDEDKAYEWYICGQVMSTYAAIEWCKGHGIRWFDTMGAGQPGIPYGVRDFKLQMGGKLYEWGRFRYVCHPCLYRLGSLVIKFLQQV